MEQALWFIPDLPGGVTSQPQIEKLLLATAANTYLMMTVCDSS